MMDNEQHHLPDEILMFLEHIYTYALAVVIPAVISLLSIYAFTRLVSPQDYGFYSLVNSAGVVLISITFGAYGFATQRFFAKYQKHGAGESFVSSYFFLILLVIFLFLIISVPIYFFASHVPFFNDYYLLGAGIFITQGFFQINIDFLRAELKPNHYKTLNIVRAIFVFVSSIILVFKYKSYGLLWGIILGNIITLLLFPKINDRWAGVKFKCISKAVVKEIVVFSFPLSLAFGMNYLIGNSDRWIISILMSVKDAGLYSAAYNLPLYSLLIIGSAVSLAAYPMIVNKYEHQGKAQANDQVKKSIVALLFFILPSAIGFYILKSNIVDCLLGTQYQAAALKLLPWFIVGSVFFTIKVNYLDFYFQLENKTAYQLYISILIAVMNIALNIYLIPKYGIISAAYAYVISFFIGAAIAFCLSFDFVKKTFPMKAFVKAFLASFLMAIILLLTRSLFSGVVSLIFNIMTGALAYLFFCVLLNWSFMVEHLNRVKGLNNFKF